MVRCRFCLVLLSAVVLLTGVGSLFAQENILFEDSFSGSLQPGWEWRRESPNGHRFGQNGLEICAEPFGENEARNILVRPFERSGERTIRIEAQVSCLEKPQTQYQQGGIYWLRDGRVLFKLVHEFVDGRTYIFPGKVPVNAETVNLRIIASGDDVIAEYAQDGGEYQRVYEGKIPRGDDDEIGLQCWNGPTVPGQWYRFNGFRILSVK